MKRVFLLSAAFLVCFFGISVADDLKFPLVEKCMEGTEGNTAAMMDCITEEYMRQDARLNTAYKSLKAKVDPERQKQLLASQRAWLAFRDAYSAFIYDGTGGSLERLTANDWVMRATAIRAAELEKAD